jgi:uncharacterized protein YoaH (UPF0181 family)
LIENI